MTLQDRERIYVAISRKLEADGALLLSQFPAALQEAGIDSSIIEGSKKQWIINAFPDDFIVDGGVSGSGRDTILFSGRPHLTMSQRSELLRFIHSEIETNGYAFCSRIPDFMRKNNMPEWRTLTDECHFPAWLKDTFPQFDYDLVNNADAVFLPEEDKEFTAAPFSISVNPQNIRIEHSKNISASSSAMELKNAGSRLSGLKTADAGRNPEVRQMHAVSYMTLWASMPKRLWKYGLDDLKSSELRDRAAANMATAIMTGGAGFINGLDESSPRFAFLSGLKAQNNQPIYYVIGVNQELNKQYWKLIDFCTPGEEDLNGLGAWVAEHIPADSAYASLSGLKEKIQEAGNMQAELLPQVSAWLEALTDGREPNADLPAAMVCYVDCWKELRGLVKQFSWLNRYNDSLTLTLGSLTQMVDFQSSSLQWLRQSAEQFQRVIDAVALLFEVIHLPKDSNSTLAMDRAVAEKLQNSPEDAETLNNFQEIVASYQNLLEVMQAEYSTSVSEQLESVTKHFKEITSFIAMTLVKTPANYWSFEQDLADVSRMLKSYRVEKKQRQREDADEQTLLSADELFRRALNSETDWRPTWISDIGRSLSSATKDLLVRELSAEYHPLYQSDRELTPYRAGMKLLSIQGNRNHEAEKCFLLGLLYDSERCIPALLNIYREENCPEKYIQFWKRYVEARKSRVITEEDALYLLFIQYGGLDPEAVDWKSVEQFLTDHHDLFRTEQARKILEPLAAGQNDLPAAFWAWMGIFPKSSACLQTTAPTQTDNADKGTEQPEINLTDGTLSGLAEHLDNEAASTEAGEREHFEREPDGFSHTHDLRQEESCVMEVQRIWADADDESAQRILFDTYYDWGDEQSVCWMMSRFSTRCIQGDLRRSREYASCLVSQQNIETLHTLVDNRPELWFVPGVLEVFSQDGEDTDAWREILEWHREHPLCRPCPFEDALERGDQAAVAALLSDEDTMASWGYSSEQVQFMASYDAQWPSELAAEPFSASADRIYGYQGNLHRFYEEYLYCHLEKNQAEARMHLFQMTFSQRRYREAAVWYRSSPELCARDASALCYLQCLTALKDLPALEQEVTANPKLIRKDKVVAQAIYELAKSCGHDKFVEETRQAVNRLAQNRFEENLIHLNLQNIQQMIGDSAQLLDLGYEQDEVNWFKDCLSKPFLKGNDAFSVASRMRLFLGDSRSEQFLLDAQNDSRAVKMLFEIYRQAGRWDDLCFLYRKNSSANIWNGEERKQYFLALSRARRPENCQEFIEFIRQNPIFSRPSMEIRWLSLKARVGAGLWDEVDSQEEELFNHIKIPFQVELSRSYLDDLWGIGTPETKERAVRTAGRLLNKGKSHLEAGEIRQLITVFDHLTAEENGEVWQEFLCENGFEEMSSLLYAAYAFGLHGNEQKVREFSSRLISLLHDLQNHPAAQELLLYSEFVNYPELDDADRDMVADTLLDVWKALLLPDNGAIRVQDWDAFFTLLDSGAFLSRQAERVLEIWTDTMDRLDSLQQRTAVGLRGFRLFFLLSAQATGPDAEVLERLRSRLMDSLLEILGQIGSAIGGKDLKLLSRYCQMTSLTEEQMEMLINVWTVRLNASTPDGIQIYEEIFLPLECWSDRQYADACADQLTEKLCQLIREEKLYPERNDTVKKLIQLIPFNYTRAKALTEALTERTVSDNQEFYRLAAAQCKEIWADLTYAILKAECLAGDEDSEEYADSLARLLESAEQLGSQFQFDSVDETLLYQAAAHNPSSHNLSLFRDMMIQAGKTEEADILLALYTGGQALDTWFSRILTEKNIQWLNDRESWWAPFVQLSADDLQVKNVIAIVGLSESPVSELVKQSVTRLLISDLHNLTYLHCFLRIRPEYPREARGKLEYLAAVEDPSLIEAAAKNCITYQQYDLALRLILRRMEQLNINSSTVGQMLGMIYQQRVIEKYPELTELVPEVFRGIRKMNGNDPQGVWKNLGRAVDIACATGNEQEYFRVFGVDVAQEFAGKSAVVIASLILRGAFEEARECMFVAPGSKHMIMIEGILNRCLESGSLSRKDELLARILPPDGNNLSMESYGNLVGIAFDKGWREECARAMLELPSYYGGDDRSLWAVCQHLYPLVLREGSIHELYRISKEYLELVALPYAFSAAKSLVVIQGCLPDNAPGRIDDNVISIYDHRFPDQRAASHEAAALLNLRGYCNEFLGRFGNDEIRREILIRAAVGWWWIDDASFDLILDFCQDRGPEQFRAFVSIYPQSFTAACYRYALMRRGERELLESIKKLLMDVGLSSCAANLDAIQSIEQERIEGVCELLDRPLPVAGLFTSTLITIMRSQSKAEAERELKLFFAVNPSFTSLNYRRNDAALKEIVNSRFPKFKYSIAKVLEELTPAADAVVRLDAPASYLDAEERDYVLVSRAAKQQLDYLHTKTKAEDKYIAIKIRFTEAYHLLGAVMTEQYDESNLRLWEFLNMTNALCQSIHAWPDVEILMSFCHKPYWKICLRCLQELIQGNPHNVITVLEDDSFALHEGCFSILYYLVRSFCGMNAPPGVKLNSYGLSKLQLENRKMGRSPNWGMITEAEVAMLTPRISSYAKGKLLYPNARNPVDFPRSFQEEMGKLLEEMRKYDNEHGINERDDRNSSPEELSRAYTEYRQIPYVIEQAGRWMGENGIPEDFETLDTMQNTTQDPEKRIEYLGKLIALNWNYEGNVKTCLLCVELGLTLFEQNCTKSGHGYNVTATPKAREILYNMSVALMGISSRARFNERLRDDIQICLSSYDDLADLMGDCGKPALVDLCQAITDNEVQQDYLSVINLIRDFSTTVNNSVNNHERLENFKSYIEKAGKLQSRYNSGPAKSFIDLLNLQIQHIQGLALIRMNVYNNTTALSDSDTVFLYGQVINTGNSIASNIRLELQVNGVFTGVYTLDCLSGNSRMPFELEFRPEQSDPDSILSYCLTGSFTNGEENVEQIPPIQGELKITDPEASDYRYNTYQVTVPVEGVYYQERDSILKTLKANYGTHRPFETFPNLAIYGMRRTGKSSVLWRTRRLIHENYGDSILFVSTNAEGTNGTVPEKAHAILVQQVLKQLGEKRSLFCPPDAENGWDSFCLKWSTMPRNQKDFEWLDDFFAELTHTWTKDFGLMILVDEVERIYWFSENRDEMKQGKEEEASDETSQAGSELDDALAHIRFWDILSRIVQRPDEKLRFIFCGSDFFINTINSGDNLTQFFQRIKKLGIGRMTRSEIEKAMRQVENETDIRYHPDAIDCLWSLLKGLPWHSKHVGNRIIERQLIPLQRTEIYPSDVLWAVGDILTSNQLSSENTFGFAALSWEERRVVTILSNELNSAEDSLEADKLFELFSEDFDCDTSQFERAIKMLVSERQLIKRTSSNHREYYQFGCELYRLYLKREKSLDHFIRQ